MTKKQLKIKIDRYMSGKTRGRVCGRGFHAVYKYLGHGVGVKEYKGAAEGSVEICREVAALRRLKKSGLAPRLLAVRGRCLFMEHVVFCRRRAVHYDEFESLVKSLRRYGVCNTDMSVYHNCLPRKDGRLIAFDFAHCTLRKR